MGVNIDEMIAIISKHDKLPIENIKKMSINSIKRRYNSIVGIEE